MLHWTLAFLIVALISGLLGFGGISGVATDMAKVVCVLAVVMFAVAGFSGVRRILLHQQS